MGFQVRVLALSSDDFPRSFGTTSRRQPPLAAAAAPAANPPLPPFQLSTSERANGTSTFYSLNDKRILNHVLLKKEESHFFAATG